MFDKMVDYFRGLWAKAKDFWSRFNSRQKEAASIGICMLGAGVLAGGIILQAAVGGLIVNTLFWIMVQDSEWFSNLLNKFGKKVDIALTCASIFFSPAAGVTGWIMGAMIGGFFTVFRIIFTEEQAKLPKKEPVKAIVDETVKEGA